MDRVMKAKKLLAVLLSLAMIMTMFPVVVFGADEPSDLLPTYQFDLWYDVDAGDGGMDSRYH